MIRKSEGSIKRSDKIIMYDYLLCHSNSSVIDIVLPRLLNSLIVNQQY
jgi:hypothetical protein